MKTLSVGEFKSSFSEILDTVRQGEKVVIAYGRQHEKVAMLVPYEAEPAQKRKIGLCPNGRFTLGDDFEISDDELLGDQ